MLGDLLMAVIEYRASSQAGDEVSKRSASSVSDESVKQGLLSCDVLQRPGGTGLLWERNYNTKTKDISSKAHL